jgi:hypothetical protein
MDRRQMNRKRTEHEMLEILDEKKKKKKKTMRKEKKKYELDSFIYYFCSLLDSKM